MQVLRSLHGMFITCRCIVGGGMGIAQYSTPTLVTETTPAQYRGLVLRMHLNNTCLGVGTLLAAGVSFGISQKERQGSELPIN